MQKLYGILDLEARRERNPEEREPGMYVELEERLRDSTFNKVINYMLDNGTAEDKEIAEGIRKFLTQENGNTTRVQITCYKSAGFKEDGSLNLEKIFNGESSFAYLSDSIMPYIHQRGDDVDCLEMVVDLQSGSGSLKR